MTQQPVTPIDVSISERDRIVRHELDQKIDRLSHYLHKVTKRLQVLGRPSSKASATIQAIQQMASEDDAPMVREKR
tara:strand:+ start:904 stop:1131 length:228 start_codon:yes stop_codon:yes gene_type:complete